MTRFPLFFASPLLQRVLYPNSRQSVVRFPHVTFCGEPDLLFQQIQPIFKYICISIMFFFFLFTFFLVFLYLSLHPCCFSCCSLLLSEKFCWVFFPPELLFSLLCTWKKTNYESLLTQIQTQFIWTCTMFVNFWSLETNKFSLDTLYTMKKRQIWCLLLLPWIQG